MRFVLATNRFAAVGGSETYLLTVAEHLIRLGHEALIYALHLGNMAELARGRGVDVVPEEDDLPARCDILLTQDGGVAYDLADRYPEVPQIFVCHSTFFELQLPPLVPGIAGAVIALSDRVERRVRAMDAAFPVVRLRQPVDTERLVPRSPPRDRPRRALLLGNYLQGEPRRLLAEAWGERGVEVVQVGTPTTVSLHPEADIAEADIVVGKSRAVLDAMSCGRPAYVYDAFGTDGWVTPDAYPAMEADAFAGQATARVSSGDQLRRDLDAYDPAMGLANRELITNHHQARNHADQLVALGRSLDAGAVPAATPKRELARLVRLKWRAEHELYRLRLEFGIVEHRARQAEEAADEARRLMQEREGEIAALRAELLALREYRLSKAL